VITLFRGVVTVTGCVLIAGASVADTPLVRAPEKKNDDTEISPPTRTSSTSSKLDPLSLKGHANPHVGKEETKDLLRAKRPK
jgi:hypothetical protein